MKVAFTFTEGGNWFETTLTTEEYTEVLNSGFIKVSDSPSPQRIKIAAIRLVQYEEDDGSEASVIYDFILKGFRITTVNVESQET
jgi:hypothetical protein